MTEKQLIKEFERWVKAGRPKMWYKRSNGSWGYVSGIPSWNNKDIYIVDDDHTELRKLQIDEPDAKFQYYNEIAKEWQTIQDLNWDFNPDVKYRLKPTEWYEDPDMVGKPVWVRDYNNEEWDIDILVNYADEKKSPFRCKSCSWTYAKPVKPEDLYQGDKDGK